ncbi:hypothetical protein ETB97_012727 [Aspergillus alliaceus]|uniref:Uncharacterized protein n=1 Tax=Petromyces alliaceus TaxID=209559 RepID=A0A8H6A6U0_PETAA|nr:hypothetical protein ETB97_012727 [Aspergillus burnettii]
MKHMFYSSPDIREECLIQTSKCTLWLYAMLNYILMPSDPKNDNNLLAKPNWATADAPAIYDLADLARRLGFRSTETKSLVQGSPNCQITRDALL